MLWDPEYVLKILICLEMCPYRTFLPILKINYINLEGWARIVMLLFILRERKFPYHSIIPNHHKYWNTLVWKKLYYRFNLQLFCAIQTKMILSWKKWPKIQTAVGRFSKTLKERTISELSCGFIWITMVSTDFLH